MNTSRVTAAKQLVASLVTNDDFAMYDLTPDPKENIALDKLWLDIVRHPAYNSDMNTTPPEVRYPPGTFVYVWRGAFTGSPGVPPEYPETIRCNLDHWNNVGQAFVYIREGDNIRTRSGNNGMYVFASAIIGIV